MKNIMLIAVIAAVLLTLTGCKTESGEPMGIRDSCIKGVVYYYNGYQLAPAYKTDGTLYLCK